MDRQRRAGLLFVLPAVVYFGLVFLVPLIESVIGSFCTWGRNARIGGDGVPTVREGGRQHSNFDATRSDGSSGSF
jgi:ABC-type sugar transport system permease subunit